MFQKKHLVLLLIFIFSSIAFGAELKDWSSTVIEAINDIFIQTPLEIIRVISKVSDNKALGDFITSGQQVTKPVGLALLSLFVTIGFINRAAEIEGVTWTILIRPVIHLSIGSWLIEKETMAIPNIINSIVENIAKIIDPKINPAGLTFGLQQILNHPASIISNFIPGVQIYSMQAKTWVIMVFFILSILICAASIGIIVSLGMRLITITAYSIIAPLYYSCVGTMGTMSIFANFVVSFFNAAFELVIVLTGMYVFFNAQTIFNLATFTGLKQMIVMLLSVIGAAIVGLGAQSIAAGITGGVSSFVAGTKK